MSVRGCWRFFLNVVAQRLERRDVQHVRAVIKVAGQCLHEQLVDAGQEGGEGLSRAGWCGDQGVPPRPDRGPGLSLNVCGNADGGLKPVGNEGMEACQRHSIDAMAASALSQGPGKNSNDYFTAKSVTFVPGTSGAFCLTLVPGDENAV